MAGGAKLDLHKIMKGVVFCSEQQHRKKNRKMLQNSQNTEAQDCMPTKIIIVSFPEVEGGKIIFDDHAKKSLENAKIAVKRVICDCAGRPVSYSVSPSTLAKVCRAKGLTGLFNYCQGFIKRSQRPGRMLICFSAEHVRVCGGDVTSTKEVRAEIDTQRDEERRRLVLSGTRDTTPRLNSRGRKMTRNFLGRPFERTRTGQVPTATA